MLIEAVKGLKVENDALKVEKDTDVTRLQTENVALRQRLERIEQLLTTK